MDCTLLTLTNKRDKRGLAGQVFVTMPFGTPGQQANKQTNEKTTEDQNTPKLKHAEKKGIIFFLEEESRGEPLADFTRY